MDKAEISCPRCGYHAENPFTARCLRCHSPLAVLAGCGGSCKGCGPGMPGGCPDPGSGQPDSHSVKLPPRRQ